MPEKYLWLLIVSLIVLIVGLTAQLAANKTNASADEKKKKKTIAFDAGRNPAPRQRMIPRDPPK